MNAQERLLHHALALIDQQGVAAFSTRTVCDLAGVTAPTLYHHFGDADGLVSAAVERGFVEFLARKVALPETENPVEDLWRGWDDYVDFAKERPRLYAAMIARYLAGAHIPAAAKARAHLEKVLNRLEQQKSLAMSAQAAADLVWATAHAAAMLHAALPMLPPEPNVVASLKRSASQILVSQSPP